MNIGVLISEAMENKIIQKKCSLNNIFFSVAILIKNGVRTAKVHIDCSTIEETWRIKFIDIKIIINSNETVNVSCLLITKYNVIKEVKKTIKLVARAENEPPPKNKDPIAIGKVRKGGYGSPLPPVRNSANNRKIKIEHKI